MLEKILYHNWNDWGNLSSLDIKEIEIDKIKWDLSLMKKAIEINKNNVEKILEQISFFKSQIQNILKRQENTKKLINIPKIDLDSLIFYESLMIYSFMTEIEKNVLIPKSKKNELITFIKKIEIIIFTNVNKK